MLRTVIAAALFLSVSTFAAPNTGYFEVCEKPSKIGGFIGPKLISPKAPEFNALVTLITSTHKAYTVESFKKLAPDGVFVSSPYTVADVRREEKIEKLCVMFGVGGVALGVHDAIIRNASVSDVEERNRAVGDAVDASDVKCLQEARKLER